MTAKTMVRAGLVLAIGVALTSCADVRKLTAPEAPLNKITPSTETVTCDSGQTEPVALIDRRATSVTLIQLNYCGFSGPTTVMAREYFKFDITKPWPMAEAVEIGRCLTRKNGDPLCWWNRTTESTHLTTQP
jgi:hypothetical protein